LVDAIQIRQMHTVTSGLLARARLTKIQMETKHAYNFAYCWA